MGEGDMKDRDDFPVLGASGDSGDSGADVRLTEDWVYDTDGSDATDDTLVGDIDGRATTLGGLKNYIAEGTDPKNKLNSTSVAQAFDADQVYTTGTYVTHEGVLYKFIADHAAGVSWADSASLVETAVVMEPDAVLDVVNGKLYVKNASGVVIWQEPDMPTPRTTAPLIAEGNGNAGTPSDTSYAKGSHVHPAETAKFEYSLPADCFPMKYTGPYSNPTQHTITSNDGLRFGVYENVILMWDTTEGAITEAVCAFYESSLKYENVGSPDTVSITFSKDGVDTAPTANTWPTLEQNTIYVRNVRIAKDADVADKVDKVNGTATGLLISGSDGLKFAETSSQESASPCTIRYSQDAFEFTGHMGSDIIRFPMYQQGTVALLQDFYNFVQQIAPAFTTKTYQVNDVCSYEGILYRCKDDYQATSSSATPNQDTTHWEAKTISDLFLKTTGGTMTGELGINFGSNYTLRLGYDASGTKLVLQDFQGNTTSYEVSGINTEAGFVELPQSAGTLALTSQIPDVSTKADSAAIDAEYDDSDTYAEGDTCMHDGKWYSCNTDISDAEEWTPAHWTEQTVQDAKLDSTSAAPAFDPTQSYSVNEYVTYNGALYVCSAAHTAAPWNPAHFTLTDMVTPDATLDVTSAGALRVVSADGEILWMQGYKLDSTSATTPAVTLSNESVNYYASPANSPDSVALTLPAITTNPPKVSDFILDVENPALTKVYGDGTTTVAAYNSASTYAVDDTVSYGGSVWKCNTASTTGTWDPTHWDYVAEYILQYSTSTTYAVGDRVLYTDSGVVKIYTCNTASTTGTWDATKWNLFGYYIPAYDTASTYAEGAKVIYGDGLYSCNTAGTTGAWDATKWDEQILTLSLGTALDNTISVVVGDGDDLSDMFTIGWGEMSEFYFTLTAFKVNGKPTYKIIKQVVVNGGAA